MFVAFSAWLLRIPCVYTLIIATSVPTPQHPLKHPHSPAKLSTLCQYVHPKCQIVSRVHIMRTHYARSPRTRVTLARIILIMCILSRCRSKKERETIFESPYLLCPMSEWHRNPPTMHQRRGDGRYAGAGVRANARGEGMAGYGKGMAGGERGAGERAERRQSRPRPTHPASPMVLHMLWESR